MEGEGEHVQQGEYPVRMGDAAGGGERATSENY